MNDIEAILQSEINRLDIEIQKARERYELTGSRATDKRVMRLRIIRDALSDALTGKRSSAKDEIIAQQTAQLQAVHNRIMLLLEAGLITHNVARDLSMTMAQAKVDGTRRWIRKEGEES